MEDKPKIVRVGIGVIVQDKSGKILLGKRNKDAIRKSTRLNDNWDWSLPGGKLEYGETFEECAIREIKEETNLDISDPQVLCVHNDKDEFAHWVTIGMCATNFSGAPIANEPDKYTEWKWFSTDNLPENIFFPSMRTINKIKIKN